MQIFCSPSTVAVALSGKICPTLPNRKGNGMQPDTELQKLFSIPEVCRILGFERSTLYSRIRAGRLAAVRLDGRVRIPRDEVQKYLAQATPISVAS
jgi:excisionase family DNA binding protein